MLRLNKIYNIDCLEGLKKIEDNSIDSIVTDPPYGLGFMGKEWDTFDSTQHHNLENEKSKLGGFKHLPRYKTDGLYKFSYNWAKECLRVLKPGGYLLSFAGTRTYHKIASAIEDTGFEIRDMIQWLYGSGFPKSLNIGKAIDKLQGNKRKFISKQKYSSPKFDDEQFKEQGSMMLAKTKIQRAYLDITKGNSEFEGWGTALKPANEPICVARKPLSEKTVVQNVLKWKTGGINIDDCRIKTNEKLSIGSNNHNNAVVFNHNQNIKSEQNKFGRFPANVIFDEETGKMLDEQSGIGKSAGGASRFFYCAKASKSEREFGLDNFIPKKMDNSRKEGNPGGDNPRNRGVNLRKNIHPTVKPIKLMQYLVRLVTPKGGVVLDPFIGSGTTGIACIKEGLNFIGFEKEKEYCNIAEARLNKYKNQKRLFN